MLFVNQDGSDFRVFIILFGMCLSIKSVICSVKLFAYMSMSLFFILFQSVFINSSDKY